MSGIKSQVVKVIQQVCWSTGLTSLLAKRQNAARVLMFHGIGDENHSTQVFEQQVKYLSKHFNIISLDTLLSMSNSGQQFTNEVVLTFDDGLRNNLTKAYPILKKYNAPATFYVCPGLIEKGSWLWNQEARERLRSMPADALSSLAAQWNCDTDIERIIVWLKSIPVNDRQAAEDHLRTLTPQFSPTDAQRNAFDMMSWQDIKSIDTTLITIGSHTTNHVIALNLSSEQLQHEIIDSRNLLEQQLSTSVEHFCYPNGDFDQSTLDAVRQAYLSAVTTKEGVVEGSEDHCQFRRIPSANTASYLAWRLFRPAS